MTDDKETVFTNPVDPLEHANAEIEAAHIHCISSFPFPESHLSRGLGPARHTRSSGCRSVDRGVNIVIQELILQDSSVREARWLEIVRKDGQ